MRHDDAVDHRSHQPQRAVQAEGRCGSEGLRRTGAGLAVLMLGGGCAARQQCCKTDQQFTHLILPFRTSP
jgi:hypothetical protein